MLLEISWTIFLLFIWFNTDAFVYYSKLLSLDETLKIKDWEEHRIKSKISYLEYISIKHKNYFTKLVSCKPCLTAWIVLLVSFYFDSLFFFPITYMISYISYKIIDKFL